MFHADPKAILVLLAVAQCWALAVVLLRAGVPGSVARRLAVLLVFEGLTLGSSDFWPYLLASSPEDFIRENPWLLQAQWAIHAFGDCGMLALYPPFLGAALQTRLTAPFLDRDVQIALAISAALLYCFSQFGPYVIGHALLYIAMVALFVFALVASVHAWIQAIGAARTRALIFVLAFGFRDVCWDFVYLDGLWMLWSGSIEGWVSYSSYVLIYSIGTLVSVPLIAYGILRTQLFDIDLRIRWTIKQSTLAAAGLSVMFLVSEGAGLYLSAELGNVAGLLVGAAIVFFLTPLQRFADKLAGAAMPNTRNTPEYLAFRKMQVYEAALDEALLDGGISTKERSLLVRLRDSLGISAADAEAIEGELQARRSAAAAVNPATAT